MINFKLIKREKLHILSRYLKEKKIDFETQIQIKKYLNFLWENEEKHTFEKELEIFNKLTNNLKDKIRMQTYGKILFQIPLFTQNFTKSFLEKILTIMKPINFEENSLIYKAYFEKFI